MTKYTEYPDPRVELHSEDVVQGEDLHLTIAPLGIVIKGHIEGVSTKEYFFSWDMIDVAREFIEKSLERK
jgi:hypothetical protein